MTGGTIVRALPATHVDVVGDVHGEIDALRGLLRRLGCDVERATAQRPLVFVGDLVDRGPDSVAVVELVARLVEAGVAEALLGNHELNLLSGAVKEGNGWFLPREPPDRWFDGKAHVPFASRVATDDERRRITAFLSSRPVALESPDLRVVHAAWSRPAIEAARAAPDLASFIAPRPPLPLPADRRGWPTKADLHDPHVPVAFHEGLAALELTAQNGHPVKVLTSGLERRIAPGEAPRWLSGRWRLLERDPWWQHDGEDRPVVFGHYWRRRPSAQVEGKPEVFEGVAPDAWFGDRGQAFCVDYSVGYRLKARHAGKDPHQNYGLAALRWPEGLLFFDDQDEPIPTRRIPRR
jgi:hypothetical protein